MTMIKEANSYFFKEQALPKNTDIQSDALAVDGVYSALEVVMDVTDKVTLTATKALTVTLEESTDNETFTKKATLFEFKSASGATEVEVGDAVARYTLPADIKKYVRVKVTTDDSAAAGAISACLHLV